MNEKLSLLQLIEERIESGKVALPPCNEVSGKLNTITANPDFHLTDVVSLITRDQSLTAEILRVANSSFYGGLTEITTVRDAAVRLGPMEVVRLAAIVIEKGQYKVKSPHLQDFMEPLWNHSVAVAMGAAWLAKKLGYPDLENQAFVGGLLHDVGSLMLVRAIDDIDQAGDHDFILTPDLVAEILDRAHTTQGWALAKHWELPEIYCDVVKNHHQGDLSELGVLINLVALADKAAAQLGIGIESDESIVLVASEEAFTVGANDILLAQLSVMLEDTVLMV